MDKVSGKLTVFFEEPFWIGVFERISEKKVSACKVTFGAEPKDYEVQEFVLKNYDRLRFSPAVVADVKEIGSNPKRVQREVHKQVHCRNRYEIAAGFEITAGADENGTQIGKPGAAGSGETAAV